MRRTSPERGSLARLLVVGGLAALVTVGATVGSTSARLTGATTATATSSTRAACASGTPYSALLSSPAMLPTLWWRFGNLTGTTTVTDSTGHGNTGSVVNAGLTFGTANAGLVACDATYALRPSRSPPGCAAPRSRAGASSASATPRPAGRRSRTVRSSSTAADASSSR